MANATKNRETLKSFFVRNAIPTEANFADLIDAQLNMQDDGVFKRAGEPLSLVSASGNQKRALRLYSNYPAANPDWLISLNPAQDPQNPSTNRAGFGVADGAGNTRLFIDPATGNIGVGTNNPADKLTVSGGDVRIEGGRYRRLKIVSDQYWAGIELVARNDGEAGCPHIDFTHGDLDVPNYGIRISAPTNEELRIEGGKLQVRDGIKVDGGVPHIEADGSFYRHAGQVYVTVDDNLYIRDRGSNTWAARFTTNDGALHMKGGLHAGAKSTLLGVAVNDGSNTGVGRGLWLWSENGSNHVIYSANPNGKSPADKPAVRGYFDEDHRMRFRTYKSQGFLFENNEEVALVDIDANNGQLWTKGAIYAGNSDIYFTNENHDHTGDGDTPGWAAIENSKNYNALMILGRKTNEGRRVKLWDHLQINGGLHVTGALDVDSSVALGFARTVTDFGAALKSGFYQSNNQSEPGDVPDNSHPWSHLIAVRHSNLANQHQLQIASSYAENDRLFFRKIARGDAGNHNPEWHEIATRNNAWSMVSFENVADTESTEWELMRGMSVDVVTNDRVLLIFATIGGVRISSRGAESAFKLELDGTKVQHCRVQFSETSDVKIITLPWLGQVKKGRHTISVFWKIFDPNSMVRAGWSKSYRSLIATELW